MKINFYATAEFNRHTGYGKLEHGIVRGLDACGAEVVPAGVISPDNLMALPLPLRVKLMNSDGVPGDVTIVTALPENCFGWHTFGKKVWLYTMSESDKVSPRWVKAINESCAGVFVSCAALVAIYRDSGVKVPVVNVDMGVDYELPLLAPVVISEGETKKKFIFLTYSYGDMRKGAHLAIMAFNILFGGKPEFELWVKARKVKETWLAGCTDPQIKIIEGEQTEQEWFDLLGQVDCFVFPSYGEGFGLPPREAVLCGVPTIATQALGMADVACWGYPLRVSRWLPAQFEEFAANAEDAKWAEPNQQDLQERMAWVVEHSVEAREHALRGRDYLLENFTWKRTAEKMLEALNDHYGTAD